MDNHIGFSIFKNKARLQKGLLLAFGILSQILFFLGLYCGLTVRHYEIADERIEGTVRIAFVSDLHSCKYGKEQKNLLAAIEKQNPDVLLLGGDIFDDDRPNGPTEDFLKGVAGKYPCYYVTGNHECWSGAANFQEKMAILDKYGIIRLAGDVVPLEIGGNEILLCGVDDPHITLIGSGDAKRKYSGFDAELSAVKKAVRTYGQAEEALTLEKEVLTQEAAGQKQETLSQETLGQEQETLTQATAGQERFTVLISHRPERFGTYVSAGFDLTLAGHAHGGQWRIPGLINGLFAPNQGLFPKYAGGYYERNGKVMIVGRGLARESTPVPRFYNPPELVIVDLVAK